MLQFFPSPSEAFFFWFLLFKFPFYSETTEVTAIPHHLPHGQTYFTNSSQDLQQAKTLQLSPLLYYLHYYGGLEPNLHYLQGISVYLTNFFLIESILACLTWEFITPASNARQL